MNRLPINVQRRVVHHCDRPKRVLRRYHVLTLPGHFKIMYLDVDWSVDGINTAQVQNGPSAATRAKR